jgi:uncharacterized protein (TIGR02145 family)
MFCNNCHQDLQQFGALIEKFQNCPLCGGLLIKTPPKAEQKGISELLDILVNNAGEKIYLYDDLLKSELEKINSPEFENARDRLSLLVTKHIASSMYKVKDFSDNEKQEALDACSKRLFLDLGLQFEPTAELLNLLQERIWQKKFSLSPNFSDGVFKDPRDGQTYKTVKIGDQVWMKEELKYKCPGFDSKTQTYSKQGLQYVAVKGWRIPTKDDYQNLINYAKNSGYGDASSVLMSRTGWEKYNITPTDNLGFDAKPYKDADNVSYWYQGSNCIVIHAGEVSLNAGYPYTDRNNYVRLIKE